MFKIKLLFQAEVEISQFLSEVNSGYSLRGTKLLRGIISIKKPNRASAGLGWIYEMIRIDYGRTVVSGILRMA
jgi:hypothetical protein